MRLRNNKIYPTENIIVDDTRITKFANILGETDWSLVRDAISKNDITLAYDEIIQIFKQHFNQVFQKSDRRTPRHIPKKPWMSNGLLKSCQHTNWLYTKYKKIPNQN